MQTGGQDPTGASWAAPLPLWPWQTRSQVTCNLRTAIVCVYLSILPWPGCFFSDSKCPEALWRAPPHLLFVSMCTEMRPPALFSGKPMAWYFLCSFFRHWHHLLRFFFFLSLSPSAFNFLFSLTSVFSAFFHSFLFSLCSPRPFLCFWFLVTCSPDSFLCRNHYLCPASFQSFWSLFQFSHPFPSCIHSFPNPPLPPPRTFEVSLCQDA